MMFCGKCGTALSPNATFCGNCGNPISLRSLKSGLGKKRNPMFSGKRLITIGCLVVMIAIISVVALIVNNTSNGRRNFSNIVFMGGVIDLFDTSATVLT